MTHAAAAGGHYYTRPSSAGGGRNCDVATMQPEAVGKCYHFGGSGVAKGQLPARLTVDSESMLPLYRTDRCSTVQEVSPSCAQREIDYARDAVKQVTLQGRHGAFPFQAVHRNSTTAEGFWKGSRVDADSRRPKAAGSRWCKGTKRPISAPPCRAGGRGPSPVKATVPRAKGVLPWCMDPSSAAPPSDAEAARRRDQQAVGGGGGSSERPIDSVLEVLMDVVASGCAKPASRGATLCALCDFVKGIFLALPVSRADYLPALGISEAWASLLIALCTYTTPSLMADPPGPPAPVSAGLRSMPSRSAVLSWVEARCAEYEGSTLWETACRNGGERDSLMNDVTSRDLQKHQSSKKGVLSVTAKLQSCQRSAFVAWRRHTMWMQQRRRAVLRKCATSTTAALKRKSIVAWKMLIHSKRVETAEFETRRIEGALTVLKDRNAKLLGRYKESEESRRSVITDLEKTLAEIEDMRRMEAASGMKRGGTGPVSLLFDMSRPVHDASGVLASGFIAFRRPDPSSLLETERDPEFYTVFVHSGTPILQEPHWTPASLLLLWVGELLDTLTGFSVPASRVAAASPDTPPAGAPQSCLRPQAAADTIRLCLPDPEEIAERKRSRTQAANSARGVKYGLANPPLLSGVADISPYAWCAVLFQVAPDAFRQGFPPDTLCAAPLQEGQARGGVDSMQVEDVCACLWDTLRAMDCTACVERERLFVLRKEDAVTRVLSKLLAYHAHRSAMPLEEVQSRACATAAPPWQPRPCFPPPLSLRGALFNPPEAATSDSRQRQLAAEGKLPVQSPEKYLSLKEPRRPSPTSIVLLWTSCQLQMSQGYANFCGRDTDAKVSPYKTMHDVSESVVQLTKRLVKTRNTCQGLPLWWQGITKWSDIDAKYLCTGFDEGTDAGLWKLVMLSSHVVRPYLTSPLYVPHEKSGEDTFAAYLRQCMGVLFGPDFLFPLTEEELSHASYDAKMIYIVMMYVGCWMRAIKNDTRQANEPYPLARNAATPLRQQLQALPPAGPAKNKKKHAADEERRRVQAAVRTEVVEPPPVVNEMFRGVVACFTRQPEGGGVPGGGTAMEHQAHNLFHAMLGSAAEGAVRCDEGLYLLLQRRSVALKSSYVALAALDVAAGFDICAARLLCKELGVVAPEAGALRELYPLEQRSQMRAGLAAFAGGGGEGAAEHPVGQQLRESCASIIQDATAKACSAAQQGGDGGNEGARAAAAAGKRASQLKKPRASDSDPQGGVQQDLLFAAGEMDPLLEIRAMPVANLGRGFRSIVAFAQVADESQGQNQQQQQQQQPQQQQQQQQQQGAGQSLRPGGRVNRVTSQVTKGRAPAVASQQVPAVTVQPPGSVFNLFLTEAEMRQCFMCAAADTDPAAAGDTQPKGMLPISKAGLSAAAKLRSACKDGGKPGLSVAAFVAFLTRLAMLVWDKTRSANVSRLRHSRAGSALQKDVVRMRVSRAGKPDGHSDTDTALHDTHSEELDASKSRHSAAPDRSPSVASTGPSPQGRKAPHATAPKSRRHGSKPKDRAEKPQQPSSDTVFAQSTTPEDDEDSAEDAGDILQVTELSGVPDATYFEDVFGILTSLAERLPARKPSELLLRLYSNEGTRVLGRVGVPLAKVFCEYSFTTSACNVLEDRVMSRVQLMELLQKSAVIPDILPHVAAADNLLLVLEATRHQPRPCDLLQANLQAGVEYLHGMPDSGIPGFSVPSALACDTGQQNYALQSTLLLSGVGFMQFVEFVFLLSQHRTSMHSSVPEERFEYFAVHVFLNRFAEVLEQQPQDK